MQLDLCNTKVQRIAVFTYCSGPARMHGENLPQSYYRNCGGFKVQVEMYYIEGICTFHQHIQIATLAYKCRVLSLFYEYRRTPEIRAQFGIDPIRGFPFAIAPLLIFIVALGILNLIVMRHVQKEVDSNGGGTVVYHQLQIASDVVVAILEISPDFLLLHYYINDIYHAVSGRNCHF